MAVLHLKQLLSRKSTTETHEPEEPRLTIEDLPTEIIVLIFEELDVIDGCCLGLSSPSLYSIHRHLSPLPILLTTPCPIASLRLAEMGAPAFHLAITKWRNAVLNRQKYTRTLPLCPHSCSTNCMLHHHIRSWMPPDMHYCKLCGKFRRWWQPDGFRCPCREPRVRPLVRERKGGLLERVRTGRWRGAGEGARGVGAGRSAEGSVVGAEGSAGASLRSRRSGEADAVDAGMVQPALPNPDDDAIQPLAPEDLDGPEGVIQGIQRTGVQT